MPAACAPSAARHTCSSIKLLGVHAKSTSTVCKHRLLCCLSRPSLLPVHNNMHLKGATAACPSLCGPRPLHRAPKKSRPSAAAQTAPPLSAAGLPAPDTPELCKSPPRRLLHPNAVSALESQTSPKSHCQNHRCKLDHIRALKMQAATGAAVTCTCSFQDHFPCSADIQQALPSGKLLLLLAHCRTSINVQQVCGKHCQSLLGSARRQSTIGTCSDLCIGVCSRADAAHSNDGQLALGQPVHVPQHLRGHVKEGRPTQSTNLHVTMESYLLNRTSARTQSQVLASFDNPCPNRAECMMR